MIWQIRTQTPLATHLRWRYPIHLLNPRFTHALVLGALLTAGPAVAQVPGIIHFQGRLAVNGAAFNGTCEFKFALVSTNGDATYWSYNNSSSGGSEPAAPPLFLGVTNGLFCVALGDVAVSNMTQVIPASVFTNAAVCVRIWVNDGTNGWQRLAPDQRVAAVGYAFTAAQVLAPVSSATNFSGALAGDITGTQKATVVNSVGGASAANVASGANAANAAASANTANTIVKRDSWGNFTAGTVTGAFAGDGSALTGLNAANLTGTVADGRLSPNVALLGADQSFAGAQRLTNTANVLVGTHTGDGSGLANLTASSLSGSAPSAVSFTGTLAGDVTGTQKGTVVSAVGGASAASVASGANAANAAASANTANTIVKRDSGGNFAAGTVIGTFLGDGSGLTGLNGANLTGTVPDGRLSANVALLRADQSFAGAQRLINAANVLVGTHIGDGSGLVNLAGSSLSGSVPSAVSFTGTLAGNVTGTQKGTVVSVVGGASAASVASGANAANAAVSADTANTIVKRDSGGNFAAGTVTGAFAGDGSALTGLNAANLTGTVADGHLSANVALLGADQSFAGAQRLTNTANVLVGTHTGDGSGLANLTASSLSGSAPSAVSFTGTLAGNVTGTQKGTVVSAVGGASAASVASGANAANAAASANTANTIVKRDSGGNFAAGTVTGTFLGDGSGLTGLNAASLTGTVPDGRLSANVALLGADQSFAGAQRLINAANVLVGTHIGDGSGLVNLTGSSLSGSAPSAVSFTGNLAGDVTGTQKGTVVSVVGGASAASVASGANAANAAVSADTANTIVKRDSGGNFAAGTVTGAFVGDGSGLTGLNAANLTGALPATMVRASIPSGMTVVSTSPHDASFVSLGYQLIMIVPAPAWTSSSAAGAPSARSSQASVWTGQELLIWGGTMGGGSDAASGGGYQPDQDSWQTISTLGAPAARSMHSAVWSGQEMIVWGGTASGNPTNSGGRYNSVTGAWVPVSTTGAPSARVGHIAVWTGTRMLIWGGRSTGGLLNDGALYDPAADQWTALALPNPPGARFGAAGVWTGDRLLVWGGENEMGGLSTGAQLTFSSGGVPSAWLAMSTTGAPSGGSAGAAVWTGQRLLVWGGQSGGAFLGNGAAYDPAADSWTAINAANAPSARSSAAFVWTGQELLIFAGQTAAGSASDGAAYNPVTDSWRPLSAAGSPLARTGPAAAWSGTELILFGGLSNGTPLANLQCLNPQPTWYFYRTP